MKSIEKVMTNGEIYQIAIALTNAGFNDNEIYIPAAINFAIQKNKLILLENAEIIEKGRMAIIEHYSSEKIENSFTIPQENIDKANEELKELLDIEQVVKLYTFSIEALGDIKFTSAQMQAIMFMIED